ncbi:hypothetical protein ABZ635_22035 [Nocardiopsis sp. NPDC007018]|uniref:hypothetical protein n=1 Tax=Nocardiopsis sp. NPDC007018 TaxID=3155721 RepID=UPI0033F6A171
MTDQRADEARSLLGHPSAIEQVAADYPAYTIHRDRDGDRHGDWVATRDGVTVSADTVSALLVRLESQELSRLQAAHGERYTVWRQQAMWIGTCRVDDGTEPTIICDTSDALDVAMTNPQLWGGRTPGRSHGRG